MPEQMVCLPLGPRCASCDLSDGLCPSANKGAKSKMKREKVVTSITQKLQSSTDGGPKIEIAIEQAEIKLEGDET